MYNTNDVHEGIEVYVDLYKKVLYDISDCGMIGFIKHKSVLALLLFNMMSDIADSTEELGLLYEIILSSVIYSI